MQCLVHQRKKDLKTFHFKFGEENYKFSMQDSNTIPHYVYFGEDGNYNLIQIGDITLQKQDTKYASTIEQNEKNFEYNGIKLCDHMQNKSFHFERVVVLQMI